MVAVAQIVGINGFGELADIFASMEDTLQDLSPLWALIANDFYKDQQRIFKLKGPGKYDDLKPSTKISKQRKVGFLYPILRGENKRLEGSLTQPDHAEAINDITRVDITLGTAVPYGIHHHAGTKVMAARPLWDENPDSALGRRWLDTTELYFEKVFNIALKNPRRGSRTV